MLKALQSPKLKKQRGREGVYDGPWLWPSVVIVVAFLFDNSSLNPAEVYYSFILQKVSKNLNHRRSVNRRSTSFTKFGTSNV